MNSKMVSASTMRKEGRRGCKYVAVCLSWFGFLCLYYGFSGGGWVWVVLVAKERRKRVGEEKDGLV